MKKNKNKELQTSSNTAYSDKARVPSYVVLISFFLVFLFSSCATLINKRTVEVNVGSNVDSVRFCVNNDTTKWYDTPARISIELYRPGE